MKQRLTPLAGSLLSAVLVSTSFISPSFGAPNARLASNYTMPVRYQHVRAMGTTTQVKMEVDIEMAGSALDILFVVDDSGSMSLHQARLLANISDLVRASVASGLDLHAGVITTNIDTAPWSGSKSGYAYKGELVGVVKKFAATADGDFESTLTANLKSAMTTDGSAQEQPFGAIQLALSEPLLSTTNKGFLRPDASLAIFILTDAEDQSKTLVADFVQFLKGLKTQASVTLDAAYIPVEDKTCDRSGEPEPVRLAEALDAFGTKGQALNLCDPAFGSKLSKIGDAYLQVAGLRTVPLKILPESLATMKVTYGSETLQMGDGEKGWIYEPSKAQIVFGDKIDWSTQPRGTRVVIEYFTK